MNLDHPSRSMMGTGRYGLLSALPARPRSAMCTRWTASVGPPCARFTQIASSRPIARILAPLGLPVRLAGPECRAIHDAGQDFHDGREHGCDAVADRCGVDSSGACARAGPYLTPGSASADPTPALCLQEPGVVR